MNYIKENFYFLKEEKFDKFQKTFASSYLSINSSGLNSKTKTKADSIEKNVNLQKETILFKDNFEKPYTNFQKIRNKSSDFTKFYYKADRDLNYYSNFDKNKTISNFRINTEIKQISQKYLNIREKEREEIKKIGINISNSKYIPLLSLSKAHKITDKDELYYYL